MNKICTLCGIEKNIDLFHKSKKTKDGKMHNCAECNKERARKYNKENKDVISEKQKIYRKNNRDYFNLKNKEWNKKTKNASKYQKNRLINDDFFRFKNRLRTLIRNSIKKYKYSKKSKTFNILGCSFEEFKVYIENQFKEGMNWGNHGKWHFDHIIPLATAKTEEDIIKLNHYTNFQPLWAKDNLKKHNKLNYNTETYGK